MLGRQSYFLASLPILPRRFHTRSRPPCVRILTVARVHKKYNCFAVYLVRVNLLVRHSVRASKMSMAGPSSMISESRWLAFFDSELFSVHFWDEFGLEFNWKGALNPVTMILWRNWGGWRDFSVFFCFEPGSVQNRVCSLYFFLVEENQKAITRLKRFGSSWEATRQ